MPWTGFDSRVCSLYVLTYEAAIYSVRSIPRDPRTDARSLTLLEAFTRIMALSDRQYRFLRTGWVTTSP